jgi:copper transport protein
VSHTTLAIALSVVRIVEYVGFVLVTGPLTLFGVVWPQGRRDRRLTRLMWAGTGLLAAATVAGPLVEAAAYDVGAVEAVGRLSATVALVRLAALAAVAAYLPDLVARDIHRWRLVAALGIVLLIVATMALQSDAVRSRWSGLMVVVVMGHLTAVSAWLGGLVAMATVLLPGNRLGDLHGILPSFSKVASTCVVTLLVTGVLHGIAVAGGIRPLLSTAFGAALILKVCLFGLMLSLGELGRRYASRVAERRLEHFDETAAPAGIHALAVAVGAEITLAFGVLAATSVLAWFSPLNRT